MCECFACVYVCALCVLGAIGVQTAPDSGTRVTGPREPPRGCREQNLEPLQEQPVF